MEKQIMKSVSAHVNELSVSRSLGKEDTFSIADEESENDSHTPRKSKYVPSKGKAPWEAVPNPNREVSDKEFGLEFVEPVEGEAVIEDEELYNIEEEKQFVLLGCFSGRFPGMKNVISLIKSWEIECRAVAKPNGFVILKFLNAKDRDTILNGPVHYIFGRRLFLRKLPEDYQLEYCDFCVRPLWVIFPGLPKQFWHPRALSKIASCIGKPICVDRYTKEMSKSNYARVLIDVDTSEDQLESINIRVGADVRRQKVDFEYLPVFCSNCCGWDHCSVDCYKYRRLERSRQSPSDHMEDTNDLTDIPKVGGRENIERPAAQMQNSPEHTQSVDTGNTIEQWRKLGKKHNGEKRAFGTLNEGNTSSSTSERERNCKEDRGQRNGIPPKQVNASIDAVISVKSRIRNHQDIIDREINRRKAQKSLPRWENKVAGGGGWREPTSKSKC